MRSMEKVSAALRYTDNGYKVIPITNGEKIPPKGFLWGEYQDKNITKQDIVRWWKEYPDANLAIITDKICVIDLDKYKENFDRDRILPYLKDVKTPIALTPHGGVHYYFRMPDKIISGCTGLFPAVDVRAKGNYIVAPPSTNGNGGMWRWADGKSIYDLAMSELPDDLLNIIYNKNSLYIGDNKPLLLPVTFSLQKGTRNDSIFHIANCLARGNAEPEVLEKTIELMATHCEPPLQKHEVKAIIESALKRQDSKQRNLSKEVLEYVLLSSGYFSVTDCYFQLSVVTSAEKNSVRQALHKLQERNIIEKIGKKDGTYKRVETEMDFIEFDDTEEVPHPIQLPFNLHNEVDICEGNIILVGGEFNIGKTTVMLNILKMNKNRMPIRYITSEMSSHEFKKRFKGFNVPMSFWKPDDMTDYIRRSTDFHSVLKPSALNIIDYLEFDDSDFTRGADMLRAIHDKMEGRGVTVIAMQKKKGQRLPRSGDLVLEKPRLAITLSAVQDSHYAIAEVIKAKITKNGRMDGKKLKFEITENGSEINELMSWGYWKI